MPTNPQVPREVAEAKGKGVKNLVTLGVLFGAIGLSAVLAIVVDVSHSAASGQQSAHSAPAQQEAPGSKDCGNGTIRIEETTVIPLQVCRSWLELPGGMHFDLQTVDRNQNLGMVWPDGEVVWITGDKNPPTNRTDRRFAVFSDRAGQLKVNVSARETTNEEGETGKGRLGKETEESGWTYVKGEVRHVNEYTWMLQISTPDGPKEFYVPGIPVKPWEYQGDPLSIRALSVGDDIRIRINKKGEVDEIVMMQDHRLKKNAVQ